MTEPLERCTGLTPDCPHTECPDGWHYGIDLPCGCTPDCAIDEDDEDFGGDDGPGLVLDAPVYDPLGGTR